jgi:hypothetical protein
MSNMLLDCLQPIHTPNADETECQTLSFKMDAPELPDDHDRRKNFDEGIQTKASQGNGTGSIHRKAHNDHPYHIPSQGQVFQQESSFEKGCLIQNTLQISLTTDDIPDQINPDPSFLGIGRCCFAFVVRFKSEHTFLKFQ